MKNFFVLSILLLSTSCLNSAAMSCFGGPSEYDRSTAQSYYDTWGTSLVSNVTHRKIAKMLPCEYRAGDQIYAYKTLWDTKYLLVRRGKAITYVEGK